jgi:hypothetical protein
MLGELGKEIEAVIATGLEFVVYILACLSSQYDESSFLNSFNNTVIEFILFISGSPRVSSAVNFMMFR